MDDMEHQEAAKRALVDQIAAALSFAEDQLEDLRNMMTDETELALSA
jgi:hypothetical protein